MDDYNAYVTAVNKIYDFVAKVKAGWENQDNFAYIDKIEELKNAVTGCADEYKKPAADVPDEEEIEAAQAAEAAAAAAAPKRTEPELQFPQPEEIPQPTNEQAQQAHNGPVVLPGVGPSPNPQAQGAPPIPLPTVSLPQQMAPPKPQALAKLDTGK